MNKVLIIALITLIGTVGCSKKTSEEHTNTNDTVGKAIINSTLQAANIDTSMLSGITEKIKDACDRNKFGLSEEACVQIINERKEMCLQQMAQRYPEQIANVEQMQLVTSSYVNCLFNK